MNNIQIEYALAKQLPDMAARGCLIATSYGDIDLNAEDSRKVAALIEKLLRKKLPKDPRFNQHAERDSALVGDRLGGMTYEAISAKHGLTRARCRQICASNGIPNKGRGRPKRSADQP